MHTLWQITHANINSNTSGSGTTLTKREKARERERDRENRKNRIKKIMKLKCMMVAIWKHIITWKFRNIYLPVDKMSTEFNSHETILKCTTTKTLREKKIFFEKHAFLPLNGKNAREHTHDHINELTLRLMQSHDWCIHFRHALNFRLAWHNFKFKHKYKYK